MSNKQQTAVEWLVEQLVELDKQLDGRRKNDDATVLKLNPTKLFEQAKEMEKEQIMKTARQCHFEGVRQSAKTSQEYIDYAEQYYNETFNK